MFFRQTYIIYFSSALLIFELSEKIILGKQKNQYLLYKCVLYFKNYLFFFFIHTIDFKLKTYIFPNNLYVKLHFILTHLNAYLNTYCDPNFEAFYRLFMKSTIECNVYILHQI